MWGPCVSGTAHSADDDQRCRWRWDTDAQFNPMRPYLALLFDSFISFHKRDSWARLTPLQQQQKNPSTAMADASISQAIQAKIMTVSIRSTQPKDAARIVAMRDQAWASKDDPAVAATLIAETLPKLIAENQHPFVACIGDAVVGTANVRVRTHCKGKRTAMIHDVVVDQTMRRRGVGKALMGYAAELAFQELSCTSLLVAPETEEAADFYRACGFGGIAWKGHVLSWTQRQ